MGSATYELFRRAILGRKHVVCTYRALHRETCPYTLGHKDGQEKALVFQFAGESSQSLPAEGEWRCFFVSEVRDATIREGPWYGGGRHSRPQTCIDEIEVDVAA
jgi:hypothetical protein